MSIRILFEKLINSIFYWILFNIGQWSELEILFWLTHRQGWAWIFPNELYLIDPNISHEILTHYSQRHFHKTPVDENSPLSKSFLNDPQTKPYQRHSLTQQLALKTNLNIFKECTEQMINRWKSIDSIINITNQSTRLTIDIIGQIFLNGSFHEQITKSMLKITRQQFTNKKINLSQEIKFIDEILFQRWQNSDQFLDFENTKLIFFAGSETSSTAVSLSLFTLAHRQDIQTQLRQQLSYKSIDEIIHNHLLDKFINELFRYWSIAPFITRQCTSDLNLERLFIRIGTNVNIFTWAMHRSSKNYSHANQFDLNRKLSNRYCYLPFSRGSRMCPGMDFAIKELKIILSVLLQSIQFEPIKESSIDVNQLFEQQQFHIDWHHAVLHTKQDIILKIKFLFSQN